MRIKIKPLFAEHRGVSINGWTQHYITSDSLDTVCVASGINQVQYIEDYRLWNNNVPGGVHKIWIKDKQDGGDVSAATRDGIS